MIQFRQKQFTEYDAMKTLYEQILRRTGGDRNKKFKIISQSALIPILKGNNVVVEKFTISTSMFGKDRYRMYIKIGAKAKLPDEVRLPSLKEYDDKLGKISLRLGGGIFKKAFSEVEGVLYQKEFKNNKGGGNEKPAISAEGNHDIYLNMKRQEILGDAVEYSKTQRSLVLEFATVDDAINALNYLPFGLNYQIYLLDA
jgi:hypothetical protein